jgi:ubiquinone/menaquinone biosynthesis C-methylase UbiE
MESNPLNFEERHIAALFNEMADEYDQLEDEWYPHLFRQIEKIIRIHFSKGKGLTALDVGCGTGLQTFLLDALGYETTGIDIAAALIERALLKSQRDDSAPRFVMASAVNIPFRDNSFDVVSCCGSTLSFIPQYPRALAEMGRVVQKKGHIILEVEQRWNLDLMWGFIDSVTGGRLGYEQSLSEAWHDLFALPKEGIMLNYPFTRLDEKVEYLPLRCFTLTELRQASEAVGLKILKIYGVHAITNLFPSTWLHEPKLPSAVRYLAHVLAWIDDKLKDTFPFDRLGCSMIIILQKI